MTRALAARFRATHIALDRLLTLVLDRVRGEREVDMALTALYLNKAVHGRTIDLPITATLWEEIQRALREPPFVMCDYIDEELRSLDDYLSRNALDRVRAEHQNRVVVDPGPVLIPEPRPKRSGNPTDDVHPNE